MSELNAVLDQLTDYLALQKEEQFDDVVCSSAVLNDFLAQYHRVPETSFVSVIPIAKPAKPVPKVEHCESLSELDRAIRHCKKCPLRATCKKPLAGSGKTTQPELVFVGYAPTQADDANGSLFAGPIGDQFERMLNAMGYTRDQVFLTSLVKCRTFHEQSGRDRPPRDEEVAACTPFIKQQLEFLKPKAIIAFGQSATSGLLGRKVAINQVRGQWAEYNGIPMMPTFHPAEFERKPEQKRPVWKDLQAVMAKLGKPVKK